MVRQHVSTTTPRSSRLKFVALAACSDDWTGRTVTYVLAGKSNSMREEIVRLRTNKNWIAKWLVFAASAAVATIVGFRFTINARAAGPDTRKPVLVELFTSEGCSSCPPADALLQVIDRDQNIPGAQVIVLSEHVDYWDHEGWRDPFDSPEITARQEAYATRFSQDSAYTPEAVIDGAKGLVGSDRRGLVSAVEDALQRPKAEIGITNATVSGKAVTANAVVAALPHADLYAVLADDHDESSVARGENSGRHLTHVAVARVIEKVGSLNDGFSREIRVTPDRSQAKTMRLIVFAQERGTGRILGVTQVVLRPVGQRTQQQVQSS